MKKIITLLAIATGFAVMAPAESHARDHAHSHGPSRNFSHSCNDCGTGVYRERAVVGRDRHGHPIYGWRTVSHNCRPARGHAHNHRHSHGHGSRPGAHINLPGLHIDLGRPHR